MAIVLASRWLPVTLAVGRDTLAGGELLPCWGGWRVEVWSRALALSVGGVVGVNARYWLGVWISRWASPQFPWATLVINITGSFVIGLLTVVLLRWLPHPNVRLLMLTGLLGGYTTFSTFAFETATLWERGEVGRAIGYVTGSVAGGLVAVALGIFLGRALTAPAAERAARSDRTTAAAPAGEVVPAAADERVAR